MPRRPPHRLQLQTRSAAALHTSHSSTLPSRSPAYTRCRAAATPTTGVGRQRTRCRLQSGHARGRRYHAAAMGGPSISHVSTSSQGTTVASTADAPAVPGPTLSIEPTLSLSSSDESPDPRRLAPGARSPVFVRRRRRPERERLLRGRLSPGGAGAGAVTAAGAAGGAARWLRCSVANAAASASLWRKLFPRPVPVRACRGHAPDQRGTRHWTAAPPPPPPPAAAAAAAAHHTRRPSAPYGASRTERRRHPLAAPRHSNHPRRPRRPRPRRRRPCVSSVLQRLPAHRHSNRGARIEVVGTAACAR